LHGGIPEGDACSVGWSASINHEKEADRTTGRGLGLERGRGRGSFCLHLDESRSQWHACIHPSFIVIIMMTASSSSRSSSYTVRRQRSHKLTCHLHDVLSWPTNAECLSEQPGGGDVMYVPVLLLCRHASINILLPTSGPSHHGYETSLFLLHHYSVLFHICLFLFLFHCQPCSRLFLGGCLVS
jgi:hypothetical protein